MTLDADARKRLEDFARIIDPSAFESEDNGMCQQRMFARQAAKRVLSELDRLQGGVQPR